MKCQANCGREIHPERLAAQPKSVICGSPECKKEYQRIRSRRNMKRYNDRRKKETQR